MQLRQDHPGHHHGHTPNYDSEKSVNDKQLRADAVLPWMSLIYWGGPSQGVHFRSTNPRPETNLSKAVKQQLEKVAEKIWVD